MTEWRSSVIYACAPGGMWWGSWRRVHTKNSMAGGLGRCRPQGSRTQALLYGCGADTFKVKLERRGGRPWEKFAVNLVVVQRLLQLR